MIKTVLNPIIRILSVLFLSFFILSTSGYALNTVKGYNFHILLIIPIFFLIVYFFSSQKSITKFDLKFKIYLFFLILIFISFILNQNGDYILKNIKLIIILTFSLIFVKNIKFNIFLKYYIVILKLIIIISLFGYVLVNYFDYASIFDKVSNVNEVHYLNGYIFFAIEGFGDYMNVGFDRNIGVFWEPGLFATFILIGFIFELIFKEKTSKFTFLIFTIGLISTKSTFGYLYLFFMIFLLYKKPSFSMILFLFLFFMLFIYNIDLILSKLVDFNPKMFSKFINDSNSLTERIDSPITNLKIFFENPFFGSGIGAMDNIYSTMTKSNQTSTLTYFLGALGFFVIIPYYYFIIGVLKSKNIRNTFNKLFFIISFFVFINKEPHTFITITYILMFYFIDPITNKLSSDIVC